MLRKIKTSLILLSTSFFLYACKNGASKDKEMILLYEKNTESLNDVLENSTAESLYLLKQKSENPQTMSVTYQWFEKAYKIQRYAKNIVRYIDQIKNYGLLEKNSVDTLYTITLAYQKEITKQDPYISEMLEKDFTFINKLFAQIGIGEKPKANTSFEKLDKLQQTGFLGLLKSRIMYLAYKTIWHYDQVETSVHFWHYGTYTSLVNQNTKIVAPEGELEINAGIGMFSIASKPTITINGTVIPLNEDGYATFKNKAPKIQGNYTVPVQISFFNQTTGKDEIKQVNIEYKVVKQCD